MVTTSAQCGCGAAVARTPVTCMPNCVACIAAAPPSEPSPTTVTRRPSSTAPHSFCQRPARWCVTISGTRLASISSDMMANSPAFAAWTPALFSSATPGGSQSNGARRSSPALVMNSSFSRGAGQGNFAATTPISVISASASAMPAAKSASVSPIVTSWPSPMAPARVTAPLPHRAGEQEQRVVGRVLDVDTHRRTACHGFASADKLRQ